jgi:hypothetical protein
MFSRPIPEFQPSHDDLAIAAIAFAPLQRVFEDGLAAGAFRPMDARTGATAAWAFLHGLASLELAGMGGPPPERPLAPDATIPAHFPSIYDTALDLFAGAIRASE